MQKLTILHLFGLTALQEINHKHLHLINIILFQPEQQNPQSITEAHSIIISKKVNEEILHSIDHDKLSDKPIFSFFDERLQMHQLYYLKTCYFLENTLKYS